MNKLPMLLLLSLFLFVVNSTTNSPTSPPSNIEYLYSVSITSTGPQGIIYLLIFNPWNKEVLFNVTIDLQVSIIDLLSIDNDEKTLLLLCSDSENNYLISVDASTSAFKQIGQIEINYNYYYRQQSFIYFVDQQTAIISAMQDEQIDGDNFDLFVPSSMQFNFNTATTDVFNVSSVISGNGGGSMIQGFDYNKNIMFIAFNENGSNSVNILSYQYPPISSTITNEFKSIKNVTNVYMLFTDPSSNVYIIKTNDETYNGNVDVCRLSLSNKPGQSTCELITTIYIGDWSLYNFNPFIVGQDKQTILAISNQSPSSVNKVSDLLKLTFVQVNTATSQQVNTVTIDNNDKDLYQRVYKF